MRLGVRPRGRTYLGLSWLHRAVGWAIATRMSASGFPRLALLLMPIVVLSACSESARPDRPGSEGAAAQEFDTASKRAARALSISQIGGVGTDSAIGAAGNRSPYARAVLCSAAIDSIGNRLRQSSGLDPAQLRLLEQAKATFDRRIVNLRRGEEDSPQDILEAGDRDSGGEQAASTDALLALQCLQELQEEA